MLSFRISPKHILSEDQRKLIALAFEPIALATHALAQKIFERPKVVKRALFIAEVAIVVFSIGYFSSLAFSVCLASTAVVAGFFFHRYIQHYYP